MTRDLCRELVKLGVDVRLVSMNEDARIRADPNWPKELQPRTVMLGVPDGWIGGAAAAEVVRKAQGIFAGVTIPGWRPEAVLAISDLPSLEMAPWTQLIPPDVACYNYVPVEGIGLPPSWNKVWKRWRPIAMARFAAEAIGEVVGYEVPMVYHGVDPEAFWKVSPQRPLILKTRKQLFRITSKAEARAFLGWPQGAVIAFRADRLMPRKAFPAMFRALAPVMARHRELCLYLHCKTVDQGGSLWHEVSKYPEAIRARIGSTGFHDSAGGAPRELLVAMYNAADLYISTSAEGFGLTVAEAMACGLPPVALAYSSLPEVVGDAGLLVEEYALIDNIYSYFWAIPREGHGEDSGYTKAVERLVSDAALRAELGRRGPLQVAQFSWASAATQFEAILRGAEPVAAAPVSAERRMAALGLVTA